MTDQNHIKHIPANWTDVVLVCRKCSKRLKGGFGSDGHQRLAKSLRKALSVKTKDRNASVGIVEVGCFDICPKKGVVLVRSSTPDNWLVVPHGADITALIDQLDLGETRPTASETVRMPK